MQTTNDDAIFKLNNKIKLQNKNNAHTTTIRRKRKHNSHRNKFDVNRKRIYGSFSRCLYLIFSEIL